MGREKREGIGFWLGTALKASAACISVSAMISCSSTYENGFKDMEEGEKMVLEDINRDGRRDAIEKYTEYGYRLLLQENSGYVSLDDVNNFYGNIESVLSYKGPFDNKVHKKALERLGDRNEKRSAEMLEKAKFSENLSKSNRKTAASYQREIQPFQYLKEEYSGRLIKDRKKLVDRISGKLEELEHTYSKNTPYSENFGQEEREGLHIMELNQIDILLTQLMEKEKLWKSIARLLEKEDLNNEQSFLGVKSNGETGMFEVKLDEAETGGLVKMKDSVLKFVPYEPAATGDNTAYNSSIHHYIDPAFASFHIHSKPGERKTQNPGPSRYDLISAESENRMGVVVSDLGSRGGVKKFNIDFYTSGYRYYPTLNMEVVDLGDFTEKGPVYR